MSPYYVALSRAIRWFASVENFEFIVKKIMSIYAIFKLECLKLKHKTNHFALRAKLFIKTTRQAYAELQALRAA